MVLTGVGWRAGKMAVRKAVKRTGLVAVNWVLKMDGYMADCWAGRIVVLRIGLTADSMVG